MLDGSGLAFRLMSALTIGLSSVLNVRVEKVRGSIVIRKQKFSG